MKSVNQLNKPGLFLSTNPPNEQAASNLLLCNYWPLLHFPFSPLLTMSQASHKVQFLLLLLKTNRKVLCLFSSGASGVTPEVQIEDCYIPFGKPRGKSTFSCKEHQKGYLLTCSECSFFDRKSQSLEPTSLSVPSLTEFWCWRNGQFLFFFP